MAHMEMKAHERFRAAAMGREFDRLPLIEWAGWWDKTVGGWCAQNPALAGQSLYSHYGLDHIWQVWFPLRTPDAPVPAYHGAPLATNMSQYQKLRPYLFPEARLSPEYLKRAKEYHEQGDGIVWFSLEGFFWFPRSVFGIEPHLYAFYDEPELYHTICADLLAWQKRAVEICLNSFDFDFMTFAEDMSYNNGPMISKEQFDAFIAPYYRQILPGLKNAGVLTVVDSDGDITLATDWFYETGVQGMLPLERQAGVDVGSYIDKHPDMCYIGHFDKMVMHKGREAIQAEFDRLFGSAVRGRLIPSVDHQTPPAVTYSDYLIYMELYRKFAADVAKTRMKRGKPV